jgi:hypothetical protein
MSATTKEILDLLKLIRSSHGVFLLSDPPKDAWRYHGVDEKISEAIRAFESGCDTTPGSTLKVMRALSGVLYLVGVEDLREGDVFRREVRRDKP